MMTTFVQIDYSTEHSGVERLERSAQFLRTTWRRTARGTVVLAAVIAAALVLANQVVDNLTDGHLMAGWIVMWLVAFGVLALFAEPARGLAKQLSAAAKARRERRRQSAEDRRLWELALIDARVMADISRGMDSQPSGDVRFHY
jgi:hypothetical protein